MGRVVDLPAGDEALLELVVVQFREAFVDERGLVPGVVVGADMIAFLERWAPHCRHGFIAVEGHSPSSNEMHEPAPVSDALWMRSEKLPHILNWGMHAFSQQYLLPYDEYVLALGLAGVSPAHEAVYGSLYAEGVPSSDLLDKYRFMSIASYVWRKP
jgi:hypothetical protein